MKTETQEKHSESQAKSYLAAIKEAMAEYESASESIVMDDSLVEKIEERIQQMPLSVLVRGGWRSSGDTDTPEEFEILLTTGGPAVRIRGELSEHCEPTSAILQHQDWGTPWTSLHISTADEEILLTFCQRFYFGE